MSHSISLSLICAFSLLCVPDLASAQDETKGTGLTKKEWLDILAKDTNVRKRKGAVLALGIFGTEQSDILQALKTALQNEKEDPQVRAQVIRVFNDTLSEKAIQNEVPTLADVLKFDKSAEVRAGAIALLGRLGKNAKPALTPLTEATKDSDMKVRIAAVETLGKMGSEAKAALPALVPLLKDSDKGMRQAVVFTLGRFGPDAKDAIPNLIPLLEKDEVAAIRRDVVQTIAHFGPEGKPALPALLKALKEDKSDEVREQIALSLAKLEGEAADCVGDLKEALRKEKNKTVRVFLVRTISNTQGEGMKNHVKDLADILVHEKEGEVRVALIQELGALGPAAKDAVAALENALGDAQVGVRDAAREALKRVKAPAPCAKK